MNVLLFLCLEKCVCVYMCVVQAYLSHTRSVPDRWKVLCPRRAQGEEEGFGAATD